MPDDSETIELPENSGSVDSRLNIPYTICTGTSLNKEFLYTTDDRQLFIKNSKNKAGTIQYYKCRLFVRQFVVSKQKPKATFTYRPRGVLSSQFVQNSYEEWCAYTPTEFCTQANCQCSWHLWTSRCWVSDFENSIYLFCLFIWKKNIAFDYLIFKVFFLFSSILLQSWRWQNDGCFQKSGTNVVASSVGKFFGAAENVWWYSNGIR